MIVWRLDPDRAAEWRRIRLAALRDAPDAFDSRLVDWIERPLQDFAARLAALPTFAAGDVIGEPLAVAAWQAGLDPRAADRGWLMSVFAMPKARGRGYATAAIRAAIADAAGQGCQSIGLHVRATSRPAQWLYQRIGFQLTDRVGVTNAQGAVEVEMILPDLSRAGYDHAPA